MYISIHYKPIVVLIGVQNNTFNPIKIGSKSKQLLFLVHRKKTCIDTFQIYYVYNFPLNIKYQT